MPNQHKQTWPDSANLLYISILMSHSSLPHRAAATAAAAARISAATSPACATNTPHMQPGRRCRHAIEHQMSTTKSYLNGMQNSAAKLGYKRCQPGARAYQQPQRSTAALHDLALPQQLYTQQRVLRILTCLHIICKLSVNSTYGCQHCQHCHRCRHLLSHTAGLASRCRMGTACIW